MKTRRSLLVAVAVAGWLLSGHAVAGQGATSRRPGLQDRLEAIRSAGSLPAIAGAVFRSGETLEQAALGVRKLGDPTPVTIGDTWHIGSVTKSFTSLIVARLVERGELAWDSTLGALLGADVAQAYAPVTLAQLLGHRAGLPANVPNDLTIAAARSGVPVVEQRAQLARTLLGIPPAGPAGEVFQYSNAGYLVVGAVLEARTGRSWEDLVRAEVFEPLGLKSGGFGPPGEPGEVTEPWGHRQPAGGRLTPAEPGPMADNPAFLGPAGTIHLTVPDLVRWVQAHLRGERGEDGLLSASSFQRLHRPLVEGGDYAMGWSVLPTGRQRMIWHNGSNTMWYAIVGFDPDEDLGVVLVTNGGIGARGLLDAGLQQLIDDWARDK